MLITFFRAIVLYIIVLIVMRLMGKREIGQLQPFELAISIMIADLASIPMTETGVPISNGIIPILGLLVMHLMISVINLKSLKAREIICGKPSILVYRGKIDEKVLKKERFTINELQERLRGNNIVNLGDVEYAILETSGEVTVIQKPEKRGTIPEDFNILPEYEGIPYDLVIDGKVMNQNLKLIGKNYAWLKKQVEKFKIKPEEALIVTLDRKRTNFLSEKRREGGIIMFKEFIISIVIVIGIIVGNNITQNYTVETVEVITRDLVEIKEEIKNEKENIELEQVKGKLEKIEEDWKERHDKLAYYIEHNELEKVETNLKGLKSYLETDEYSEAMSELDKCIFILDHIQRKNEFNLQNIF